MGGIGGNYLRGEAGDGAAGAVFVGDGRYVGISNILDREAGRWLDRSQPADAGSQDEAFGEGVHLFAEVVGGVGIVACAEFAVEDDCLDNHCHVGEVEVTFGTFPQADEDVVGVVAVAEGSAHAVPVERYFFGGAIEYVGYIVAEVEVEIVDSTLGKG